VTARLPSITSRVCTRRKSGASDASAIVADPATGRPVAALHIGEEWPLCACLPKPPSPPRRNWISLAEQGNSPMVTAFATRPSVPDRTPRAAPRIDNQLGTGAELPPLPGDVRRFQRLDAVAGAVAHFQRAMMMDIDQAAQAMRDEDSSAARCMNF
jgi:hypothetical protein